MNETTFENVKVGNKVWSIIHGWGTVKRFITGLYPIEVVFNDSTVKSFAFNGKLSEGHTNRTLFWDEIKISPPPRPKRKVKKTVIRYVNVLKDNSCKDKYSVRTFDERTDAGSHATRNIEDIVAICVPIKIDFEVEE